MVLIGDGTNFRSLMYSETKMAITIHILSATSINRTEFTPSMRWGRSVVVCSKFATEFLSFFPLLIPIGILNKLNSYLNSRVFFFFFCLTILSPKKQK